MASKDRKNGVSLTDVIAANRGPNVYKGEIEFIVKDRNGRVIHTHREPNLIKVFAKEMLAHRVAPTNIWDPAASGGGAWVSSDIDPADEFSIKYMLFGASYDSNGVPLGPDDSRYYTRDTVTEQYIPNNLEPGATDNGGLINAVPIAEPGRPLKRIESVYFEPSYQPTSAPILQDDVRAVNNILVVETTLETDEYNGFGLTDSDYFTITEVALAGGREITTAGACECNPTDLFLEAAADDLAFDVTLTGGNVVTIDSSDASDAPNIKKGDQIKLVAAGGSTTSHTLLDQVSPFYLVTDKSSTGLELELDRTPVDSDNVPLTGAAGIFRSTLRLFSQRILSFPVHKSSSYVITVRWRIIFS